MHAYVVATIKNFDYDISCDMHKHPQTETEFEILSVFVSKTKANKYVQSYIKYIASKLTADGFVVTDSNPMSITAQMNMNKCTIACTIDKVDFVK